MRLKRLLDLLGVRSKLDHEGGLTYDEQDIAVAIQMIERLVEVPPSAPPMKDVWAPKPPSTTQEFTTQDVDFLKKMHISLEVKHHG